jgi:hypothetical protein
MGFDRSEHGKAAGMRTTLLVCLVASVAMIQVNMLLPTAGRSSGSLVMNDLMRLQPFVASFLFVPVSFDLTNSRRYGGGRATSSDGGVSVSDLWSTPGQVVVAQGQIPIALAGDLEDGIGDTGLNGCGPIVTHPAQPMSGLEEGDIDFGWILVDAR